MFNFWVTYQWNQQLQGHVLFTTATMKLFWRPLAGFFSILVSAEAHAYCSIFLATAPPTSQLHITHLCSSCSAHSKSIFYGNVYIVYPLTFLWCEPMLFLCTEMVTDEASCSSQRASMLQLTQHEGEQMSYMKVTTNVWATLNVLLCSLWQSRSGRSCVVPSGLSWSQVQTAACHVIRVHVEPLWYRRAFALSPHKAQVSFNYTD